MIIDHYPVSSSMFSLNQATAVCALHPTRVVVVSRIGMKTSVSSSLMPMTTLPPKNMTLKQRTRVSDCFVLKPPGQDICMWENVTDVSSSESVKPEMSLFSLPGWRGECWENWADDSHCWHGGVPNMWHLAGQNQNVQVRHFNHRAKLTPDLKVMFSGVEKKAESSQVISTFSSIHLFWED